MFRVFCGNEGDCFEVVAHDNGTMMAILANGCPNCSSHLEVVSHGKSDADREPKSQEEVQIGAEEVDWPLHGPFNDLDRTSHSDDSGSRSDVLSSNTPHFIVSQAAVDVLAGMLVDGHVTVKEFGEKASYDLSILRKKFNHLETRVLDTKLRTPIKLSSGFPRHKDEATSAMIRWRKKDMTYGSNEVGQAIKKSKDRFLRTVIGGPKQSDIGYEGALYQQGLIAFEERTEFTDLPVNERTRVYLTKAGIELASIRNEFLHNKGAIEGLNDERRHSLKETKWWFEHTHVKLKREAKILYGIMIFLRKEGEANITQIYEYATRDLDLKNHIKTAKNPEKAMLNYLRALLQRWIAIGLFNSKRGKGRIAIYSLNEECLGSLDVKLDGERTPEAHLWEAPRAMGSLGVGSRAMEKFLRRNL